jgi:hypothetical protein
LEIKIEGLVWNCKVLDGFKKYICTHHTMSLEGSSHTHTHTHTHTKREREREREFYLTELSKFCLSSRNVGKGGSGDQQVPFSWLLVIPGHLGDI